MSLLLEAKDVSFCSGQKKVLSSVSLCIEKEDVISIVGSNGSGKTVFLKIISKLLKPSSGTVTHHEKAVVSYMPQRVFVSSHLPVKVSDFFALRSIEINEEILQEMEISHESLSKDMHLLSGGQMQKILFSAAIMSNANVLILDEPEQNLDISSKLCMYKAIAKNSRSRAIIIASHDPDMVFKKSTKILHLTSDGTAHHHGIESINKNLKEDVTSALRGHFFCHQG